MSAPFQRKEGHSFEGGALSSIGALSSKQGIRPYKLSPCEADGINFSRVINPKIRMINSDCDWRLLVLLFVSWLWFIKIFKERENGLIKLDRKRALHFYMRNKHRVSKFFIHAQKFLTIAQPTQWMRNGSHFSQQSIVGNHRRSVTWSVFYTFQFLL